MVMAVAGVDGQRYT